jgi:hypothetical protein
VVTCGRLILPVRLSVAGFLAEILFCSTLHQRANKCERLIFDD